MVFVVIMGAVAVVAIFLIVLFVRRITRLEG